MYKRVIASIRLLRDVPLDVMVLMMSLDSYVFENIVLRKPAKVGD